MTETIKPATVLRFSVDGSQPLEYYLYLPESGHYDNRVFVSVHGISRNAREHLEGFAAQAERFGAAMIAPIFPLEDFHRYQRLGASVSEGRADLAFDQMLQDARLRIGMNPFPLHVFGFSGGGQFVHRYAMFYPKRVGRMALAAPGWYTFPAPNKPYPYGLKSSSEWPKLNLSPARFLHIPTMVLVGEKDDIRDADLNKSRRIDSHQGLNRVERAERWVLAQRSMARAFNVPADYRLESIPGATHAYERYLANPKFAEHIFSFLFADNP